MDGGASGCRLAAYGAGGELLAIAEAGPASLTLGEMQAWDHVSSGIASLAGTLALSAGWYPGTLCLGLAGSLQRSRRERFLSLVPPSVVCHLVTDGHAQLLGATGGAPGACLAIGTGSVLHWQDSAGDHGMAGGWGFPAGDEASGAWLGLRLLGRYLRHRDAPGSSDRPAPLFAALEERIGRSISDVQRWSTNTRSTDLATLAPLVIDAAADGDAVADGLLDEGAHELERLLSLAPAAVPLYLVGGLAPAYRGRLGEIWRRRLREPLGGPLDGLRSLARSAAGPGVEPVGAEVSRP